MQTVFLAMIVVSALGYLLYILGHSVLLVIVSRAVIGLGTGALAPCRTVVVSCSDMGADRTKQLTVLSIFRFVGYAITSLISSFWTQANFQLVGISITAFNMPALVLLLLNVAFIPLVWLGLDADIGKESITSAPTVKTAVHFILTILSPSLKRLFVFHVSMIGSTNTVYL